jgi:hypothetical protein
MAMFLYSFMTAIVAMLVFTLICVSKGHAASEKGAGECHELR